MKLSAIALGVALAIQAEAPASQVEGPALSQVDGPFDVLIRNGRVMDGTGNPWLRQDVGITAGRIAAIGHLSGARATRVIEAGDRYVTPGFIDVHSHAAEGLTRDPLRQGQPMLAQGITMVVVNPDGGGPIDLAAQRAELEKGVGVNVALLIGHASVRRAVLGMDDRAPSTTELDKMRELVRRGMREGAFGLSSGPFYAPGSYARTDELVALAKVAAEFDGLYTSHIRDESNYTIGLLASVDEVIRIAEESSMPGIVTHMKALGPDNWGLSVAATMRIDAARARGVQVFADQYAYTASSTGITGALVPRWAQVGGDVQLRERIKSREIRQKLLAEVRENIRRRGGADSLVIASYRPDPSLEGKSLGAIAEARKQPPEDAALDLLDRANVSLVSFNMSEVDVDHIMRQPYTMTCSDGGLQLMTEGKPHPRNYGAFARKLARYVRERGTIDLETAVRSMTSLPALVFGFAGRGVLRAGAWADIAIFDPARVRDTATYDTPHQLAEGMDYVLVNGVLVVDEGKFTSATPGQVLRTQ